MEQNVFYATYGSFLKTNSGEKIYYGDYTDNGECYKDLSAWKSGEGVIYISEYQLKDLEEGVVEEHELWTKQTWFDWVKDEVSAYLYTEENISDDFIEYIALDILELADWQDLTTLFNELEQTEWLEDNYMEWKENR
jgi:hypothetical protein